MRWTDKEIAYVREHARFQSAEEMAEALGKTRNAVLLCMSRRGIRSGVSPRHTQKRAVREYVRSRIGTMTCAQIARELGLARCTVWGLAKYHGLDQGASKNRKTRHATWYGSIQVKWTPDEYRRLEEIKKARAGVEHAPAYLAHDFAVRMGWTSATEESV